MINATPASKLKYSAAVDKDACDCVCPCCKQRRCTGNAAHRDLPKSEKDHWHHCECGVCPVW